MSKRWLAFLPLALFVSLVAIFAAALIHGGATPKFAQHVGDKAPALAIKGAADGHPHLVNFFASWCVPCHAEHELLKTLAGSGIPIIGIAYEDKPAAVAAFLAKQGNPYIATTEDTSGRIAIDWGATGVPETFLVDADGTIRFHANQPLTDTTIARDLMPVWNELQK